MDSAFTTALEKPILFVQGKGGVGKSSIAHALARISAENYRTLLISIEDPLRKPFDLKKLTPHLDHLNNEATAAFEEYAGIKIGAPGLVKVFLQNRFMSYIAKAAPGIRELVLMGKIWHEHKNYERIIVDMPATGHGLTLFQSLFNWGNLFGNSILARDASAMIKTFSDPKVVGHLIVSIPEEMPLVESLELREHLLRIFPKAEVALALNRLFPVPHVDKTNPSPEYSSDRPFALTAHEHATRKVKLEEENLALWKGEDFTRVPYLAPPKENAHEAVIEKLTTTLREGIA